MAPRLIPTSGGIPARPCCTSGNRAYYMQMHYRMLLPGALGKVVVVGGADVVVDLEGLSELGTAAARFGNLARSLGPRR